MGFDLELTDEQKALQDTLHHFAEDVLRPRARDAESGRKIPGDVASQLHDIGIASPVDERFGGGGTFDAITYCIAAEELAWGDPGIAYQVLSSGLAAVVAGRAASDAQKRTYLPRFAAADPAPGFVAIGEKVAAGDLGSLEGRVEDGAVSGIKYGVVDAESATFGLFVGRDDAGIAAAIVEPEAWEVLRPEEKMGLEAAPTWVVRFDGLGDPLPAGPGLEQAILWSKLMVGAIAVGNARASLEYASSYAIEREAFGRPIGAFQGISFKIADMAIEVDAARTELWRAAWLVDRNEATYADVAQAVGHALRAATYCGDEGVQILGGHGYVKDHPVEMWFRDAVTLSAFDAPDITGDVAVTRVFTGV